MFVTIDILTCSLFWESTTGSDQLKYPTLQGLLSDKQYRFHLSDVLTVIAESVNL